MKYKFKLIVHVCLKVNLWFTCNTLLNVSLKAEKNKIGLKNFLFMYENNPTQP